MALIRQKQLNKTGKLVHFNARIDELDSQKNLQFYN